MNFDISVKVVLPVLDRGHTRAFYEGLVHGVNTRPALRMLYCRNIPALLVAECEPRDPAEPITCMACLATGVQVPTIDGIEVVAERSALPEGVCEGSHRWVMTDAFTMAQEVELWVYTDVGWRRVS